MTIEPDSTPPVIAPNVTGTLGLEGWYVSTVLVSWTVTDPESYAPGCPNQSITTDTTGLAVSCASDSAGGAAGVTFPIKIDRTRPVLTQGAITPAANAAGWRNTAVSVAYTCSDATSGLAEDQPASGSVSIATEGTNQSVTLRCTDVAGNVATRNVTGINIDSTPPLVAIASPADGTSVLLGAPLSASYSCSDSRSGLASCVGPLASGSAIDTTVPGLQTFSVVGTDRADNVSTASNSYRVMYGFSSFLAPIDNGGVVNKAKAGRTIPVKWQLSDASGAPITSVSSFASLTSSAESCTTGVSDAIEDYAVGSGSTSVRYDATAGYFLFNWATSSSWTGCRRLTLTLADGMQYSALFSF
jgi:hypothetical protein